MSVVSGHMESRQWDRCSLAEGRFLRREPGLRGRVSLHGGRAKGKALQVGGANVKGKRELRAAGISPQAELGFVGSEGRRGRRGGHSEILG